jgi:hypothetical protein
MRRALPSSLDVRRLEQHAMYMVMTRCFLDPDDIAVLGPVETRFAGSTSAYVLACQ